jgi:hypothetical protein
LFKLLIDTCIWLDTVKDYQRQPQLSALEELIRQKKVELILPKTIIDEFARNKARVIEESGKSLSGTLKRAKEAVEKFGDPKLKRKVLRELNDVDYRIPTLGSAATGTVERIERLFTATPVIPTSDLVTLRAAQRAIDKRAPFHKGRNSMNDAVLIETYTDAMGKKERGVQYAFVTHNTKDFSDAQGDDRRPHPDFADNFSRVNSLYFTNLGEALRRVDPEQFSDLMIEQEWIEEPRRLPDILEAMDLLFNQVWYNRHQLWRQNIAEGEIKLVDKETFPVKDHAHRPMQRDIWKGALKAAARVEKTYGLDQLGPWDDFEWGMINGKLSALRWVLGDEWDMLDT